MAKRWYVVHTYSQFEKSVQRALQERIAREGMEDLFGQILVAHDLLGFQVQGHKRLEIPGTEGVVGNSVVEKRFNRIFLGKEMFDLEEKVRVDRHLFLLHLQPDGLPLILLPFFVEGLPHLRRGHLRVEVLSLNPRPYLPDHGFRTFLFHPPSLWGVD